MIGTTISLAWSHNCCIIAVWACKHDGQVEILKHVKSRFRVMVRGIVKDDHRALPPAWPFLLQLLVEILEENLHYLTIGVRLCEREVHIAKGIDSNNHRNPRS